MSTFYNFFIGSDQNQSQTQSQPQNQIKKVFSQNDVIEELKKFQLGNGNGTTNLKKVVKQIENKKLENSTWNELLEKRKKIISKYEQEIEQEIEKEIEQEIETVQVDDEGLSVLDFNNDDNDNVNEQVDIDRLKQDIVISLNIIENEINIIRQKFKMLKNL